MGREEDKVKGFKFAARAAGIRKSGRLDVAMIYSEVPATCAGVFTTNRVVAAPVTVSSPRIRKGLCQAVVLNSGNANACTGDQGLRDALRCAEVASHALGIPEDLVAVSSTGVIGVPLPMEKLERHVSLLPGQLKANEADATAQAIMTTDSFPKMSFSKAEEPEDYAIMGIAKGAGMIHPNMATMLAFVLTDAQVDGDFLDAALRRGVDRSFNIITVDRDTSTNDMVLVLANGLAGNRVILEGDPEAERFERRLQAVLLELAKMIVRDGEGATKLVEIRITGAADLEDARKAAFSVATSNLVKTAFFGEDANWGRIIAAVGYSGAQVDPNRVEIRFEDVVMAHGGIAVGGDSEARATEILKRPEFVVTVDLGLGNGEGAYYTSDLTYDYVKINAAYRT